jgi:hypothetical protein
MNIFAVRHCAEQAARDLPDKLICKMPLESAQMLCTAHRELSPHEYCEEKGLYLTAFKNHPCTIWARTTHENYRWLLIHWITLCEQFYVRYGKQHKSWIDLWEGLKIFPMDISEGELTPFAQAMPDIYKNPKNHIAAYRNYMIAEKHYAAWDKGVAKPKWWNNKLNKVN